MLRTSPSIRFHVCPICEEFRRRSYSGVLRHIGAVHSFKPNFKIACNFCPVSQERELFKFDAYKRHVYKHHRDELGLPARIQHAGPSASLPAEESEDATVLVVALFHTST